MILVGIIILAVFLVLLAVLLWSGNDASDRNTVEDGHGQSHQDYTRRGK